MSSFGETGELQTERLEPRRNSTAEGRARSEQARFDVVRLRRLIECEIVPRLLLLHSGREADAREVLEDDVEELTRLAIRHEAETALAFVRTLVAEGVDPLALRVGLLAPAARLLGEYWEDDVCGFAEVSLGMSRLQQVLWALQASEPPVEPRHSGAGVVLVATTPGDQHCFGAQLVADALRHDGWDVRLETQSSAAGLAAAVRASDVRWVALSISNDFSIEPSRALIARLRKVAGYPHMRIVVGGAAVEGRSKDGGVGADGVVRDPGEFVRILRTESEAGRSRPR